MTSPDRAERLLKLATIGLPANRNVWGVALRAELASINDPSERQRFAHSAALMAFRRGWGTHLGLALVTGVFVVAVAVTTSRLQLANGGPGLLPVTVPIPALLLLLLTGVSAGRSRSFPFGLATGAVASVAGFLALFAVLAIEGIVWMERLGVFILDGDPPKQPVDNATVVFDVFTTGMWVGHAITWLVAILIGAALGALLAERGVATSTLNGGNSASGAPKPPLS